MFSGDLADIFFEKYASNILGYHQYFLKGPVKNIKGYFIGTAVGAFKVFTRFFVIKKCGS